MQLNIVVLLDVIIIIESACVLLSLNEYQSCPPLC